MVGFPTTKKGQKLKNVSRHLKIFVAYAWIPPIFRRKWTGIAMQKLGSKQKNETSAKNWNMPFAVAVIDQLKIST